MALPSSVLINDLQARREQRRHQVLRVAEVLSWFSIAVGVLTLVGGMVVRFF